jgi:arylsulfatase A
MPLPRPVLLLLPLLAALPDEDHYVPPERRPNVIYILADDLGYGELGCYGQEKIRTPNLDRVRREGMRFTQHYSGSPVCAPSRCVLLTGLHTGHAEVRDNWENGGWGEFEPEGQWPLAPETVTIAELLADNGYRCGAFGKWGNGGPGTTGHPNRQGFDTFVGYLCQRQAHNYYPTHLWRDDEKLPLPGNEYFHSHQRVPEPLESEEAYYERFSGLTYAPDVMIEAALDFIDECREEPFFLFYASPVPHGGLQVPRSESEAYRGEFEEQPYLGHEGYVPHPAPLSAYAGMITRMDREVGRILDRLDAHGLTEDTIVMFSSDNGTTFNAGVDAEFFDSTAGLRGLKCSVYEGGIRVPFLVRWPGHIRPGSTGGVPSSFQDVIPTVLELIGAETPEGLDGISLVPALFERWEQLQHDYLYWEYGGQQALRVADWKGVRTGLRTGDLHMELYNLRTDPGETNDISSEMPQIVDYIAGLMEKAHTPSEAFPLPVFDYEPGSPPPKVNPPGYGDDEGEVEGDEAGVDAGEGD